ncbi:hypothetical protein PLICRDRAFT_179194 [Plicaturopsis crispa FD-325 SS-3]|uniref:Unplaced genomic scaffold PLICRscaffold_16, whole genome shotgun sequence n=1 Tax=Plicaturopsis crispa FD-325 SS-3 TaxID=944288 RepID=A0A0C9T699_PLICR|nr:hypothetical protein PLICRDRAFT_179194 [Plicaturopsis crispa FD-325 SS-3]
MLISSVPANLNSVAQITLNGIAKDADGGEISITLPRCTPPPVEPVIDVDFRPRQGGLPERRPSLLPAPGDLSVTLSVTDRIGVGRVGFVYGVSVEASSSPTGQSFSFPPLVVKISRQRYTQNMAREAWFYEEMECLQGSAIARCYGFFGTELGNDVRIGLWDKDEESDDEEEYSPGMEPVKKPLVGPYTLSILVLERLGGRLPLRVFMSAEAKEDMKNIYDDMAELGIFHRDIRWANFLRAPASPPGLPSLPSPFQHRTYTWRVIDFDNSEKNNDEIETHQFSYGQYMELIIINIPYGYPAEPWE